MVGRLDAEKTLKKVQEGLEVFDDHQEQYDTTDPANANAREKLESQARAAGWDGACQGGPPSAVLLVGSTPVVLR